LVKDLDSEMWELSIFKKSENSNKFQKKIRFWKEKSVEDVETTLGQWHRPH
jgi:hypothetical protein